MAMTLEATALYRHWLNGFIAVESEKATLCVAFSLK
jgi:hypothetical protein